MTRYRERLEAGEYAPQDGANDLEAMSKEELLAYARRVGADVSLPATKATIREAIDAAEGRS